jgi:hypothetical protein
MEGPGDRDAATTAHALDRVIAGHPRIGQQALRERRKEERKRQADEARMEHMRGQG